MEDPRVSRRLHSIACLTFVLLVSAPTASLAFSVLAHQGVIDRSWDDSIVPALEERFPGASKEDLEKARAFAYGGSHIADLGYFPFGSRLFTDLVHYVRSGHFVAAMIRNAGTREEYAFALGAASHYVADSIGHPVATNRVVPEIYPDLREEFGEVVTYEDDHSAHMQTEFRFDILQLAQSRRSPDLFQHAIAFEVSKELLDRSVRETYGLSLEDLFTNTDVAITTYRWGFRQLIQEATGIAWALYQDDIQQHDPGASEDSFVGNMSRADFAKEFGKSYSEAGYFSKFFAYVANAVPDVGPLERLPYKPLPQEARERFNTAFDQALGEYRSVVVRSRNDQLELEDRNLDTGSPTRKGEYPPADEAYEELVETLDERDFADASADVREHIVRFYRDPGARPSTSEDGNDSEEIERALARLGAPPASRAPLPADGPAAGAAGDAAHRQAAAGQSSQATLDR